MSLPKREEDELRHSEAGAEKLVRLILDSTPAFLHIARPDGSFDYINKQWSDYLGLSVEAVRGAGWRSCVHPDDLQQMDIVRSSMIRFGKSAEHDARIRRCDRAYRLFWLRATPICDENGTVVLWCGTSVDIEESPLANASRSNNLAHSVLKHYPVDDSIFIDDSYLIKGLAGQIFWKVLRIHSSTGRTVFSNKEIRLDASLKMPDIKDNLESRLILLRRRLQERCSLISLTPTARGQFRLELRCSITLVECYDQLERNANPCQFAEDRADFTSPAASAAGPLVLSNLTARPRPDSVSKYLLAWLWQGRVRQVPLAHSRHWAHLELQDGAHRAHKG